MPSASEVAEVADEFAATQSFDSNLSLEESASVGDENGGELVNGQSFGDYRIVRRLGRGGMGTVYEADHDPTGRRVALKVLAHSWDNSQARARFLREGRLAASINHPNSVYVFGTEEIGDTPSISMELIHGGTLQQLVKTKGRMAVSAAVDAVLQIIEGLEAADRKGVLHRDIKPANCFIDQTGVIKIGDFGLSISTEARDDFTISNVTCKGMFLGTPAFASPEQLRGDPLDRRSDIYAVGVTLFYLLTGQTPFSGENMVQLLATVLDKQAPSVRSIRGEVPEELDIIIQRCLQKSAGQRFASYDALREVLMPLSSMRPMPASPGVRLIASIIDLVTLSAVFTIITYACLWFTYGRLVIVPRFSSEYAWFNVGITLASLAVPILYYALCEWRFGKTIGKHLMRLRVVGGNQRMSLRQTAIRAAIFIVAPNIPAVAYSVMVRDMTFEMMQQSPYNWIGMLVGLSFYALSVAMFSTARIRNGFAGIHELASDTRVICRPSLRPRPSQSATPETFDAVKDAERIGPYHVLQILKQSKTDRLVLAYDTKLLRRVWVRTQKPGSPEIDSTSRNFARTTRLRWLGARRTDTECWDCYEAPSGQTFTKAIDDGLRWEAIVDALRQLARELQISREEASLPKHIELTQLWITEEESMKLLPFDPHAAPHDAMSPSVSSESEKSKVGAPGEGDSLTELRLLQQAVRYAYKATDLAGGSPRYRGTSLHAHESLDQAGRSPSLDVATQRLDVIAKQPTINVRRRTAAMLVVSLAVPSMLFVSTLIASLPLEHQKANMPQVTQLSKAMTLLEIESRSRHESKPQRMAALETWIAANFREVAEDREKMDSFYAMIAIPHHRRELLNKLLAKPDASPQQIVEATESYEKILAEPRNTSLVEFNFFSVHGLLFLATSAWLETIWVPSLVTAIACGGGALLWMFGLTLVNRRGQRASRLRVFIRMLIGGLPAMGYVFVFLLSETFGVMRDGSQLSIVIFVVGSLMIAAVSQRRLIHDRLAGTYLVAR